MAEVTHLPIAELESAIHDVLAELSRAVAKHGPQRHENSVWLTILVEEVGEAAERVCAIRFGDEHAHTGLRCEVTQIVAMALYWLACLIEVEKAARVAGEKGCDNYLAQDDLDIMPCARCGHFRDDHPSESIAQRRKAEQEASDV